MSCPLNCVRYFDFTYRERVGGEHLGNEGVDDAKKHVCANDYAARHVKCRYYAHAHGVRHGCVCVHVPILDVRAHAHVVR